MSPASQASELNTLAQKIDELRSTLSDPDDLETVPDLPTVLRRLEAVGNLLLTTARDLGLRCGHATRDLDTDGAVAVALTGLAEAARELAWTTDHVTTLHPLSASAPTDPTSLERIADDTIGMQYRTVDALASASSHLRANARNRTVDRSSRADSHGEAIGPAASTSAAPASRIRSTFPANSDRPAPRRRR